MKCELPIILRCCFCFPLRYGLLVCSYIKQIINVLFLWFIIFTLYQQSSRKNMTGSNFLMPSLFLIFTIFDISFTLLFIIGGHTKNYRKMRIFYRYSIFVQCFYTGDLALVIAQCVYYSIEFPQYIHMVWYMWEPMLMTHIVIMIIQLYLIILVRSEYLKLKNNSQFEFVNHEAEEKCTANIDFEKRVPVSI